jgi:flagellar motility protein MotE (MotC chaperone)
MQNGRSDYATLYSEVKRVVFVRAIRTPKIEPKAILISFLEHLDTNVIYTKQLDQVVRIAGFARSKSLLHELIDLVAYERGLEKKKSVHARLAGTIAGTQDLIRTLSSQREDYRDETERIEQQNEDLRAALEIAEQQLESLQDEIDQIRDEAKQEAVVSFFQEMNSVKFSNLLEQFSNAEEMLKRLKRENYKIPQEIEVIPALIRMFMRFLKMHGVQPKALIGLQRHINLKESEEYEYVGSDFEDADEQKAVEIKSTGWEYAGTLISKPKAEEV